MKKTYKYWTKEDETLLKALRWSEKFSIAEIADHMGRTKSSVYNRLAILKRVEPKVRTEVRFGPRAWAMAILTGRK
jgi:IS30 family transposase